MTGVAAPADKRFRRAHVAPGRRRRAWDGQAWRIARLTMVLLLVTAGAVRGTRALLNAQALQVSRITLTGNERLSRGEVLALVDGLRGQSMVTVSLDAWRARLLRSPWVADAMLRRVLPGTVAVAIAERRPMGIGRIGGELYLVDWQGTVIDEYGPNYADLDLPLIDGLAVAPTGGGPVIDDRRAALASRVINALDSRKSLAKTVSEIDVTDARDAAVILKGDPTLIRLGDDQFAERLQTYLDLAPTLRAHVPEMDYVDLRFDERLYVRPVVRPGAQTTPPAVRAAPAPAASGAGRAPAAKTIDRGRAAKKPARH